MAGRQLIICGMHRSGTSLVASVLGEAGLDIGQRLNGPGPGNRRGHFEDVEIWQLHEDMLAAAGWTPLEAGPALESPDGKPFVARAQALIAARRGREPWGWKDPRTSLLLDFWDALLPDARYLFVYRHPVDVALSLLRRATEPEASLDPRLPMRSWEEHNRRLLAFRDRFPERCFVAQMPAAAADLEGLVARVAARFDLPLRADGAAALYAPGELAPPTWRDEGPRWEGLIPEALELYRRLEAVADVPSSAAPVTALPSERERESVRLCESLLFDLLESRLLHQRQRAAAEAFAAALVEERAALVENRAALVEVQAALGEERARRRHALAQLADATARRDTLAATLAAIERSRTFALVDAWWRVTRRLRRRP